MERIFNAFKNSGRAWAHLIRNEAAFKQEVFALALALPVAWVIAEDWMVWLLLVSMVLLVLIVEVLNTGIEAACNAVSRKFSADIQIAKDCGSLAVLLACAIGGLVWLFAFAEAVLRWMG